MLSAEHYALEHRAVQQLLDIRQKEVAFLTDRFNAIGTQSSLVAGFVVTTLTAVDAGARDTHPFAKYTFWASSSISLALSFHCLLNSTFAAVWGPGLALRGPSGSVSRAFYLLRSDQKHVMFAFVGSVFFFIIQCAATFFVLDHIPGWTASGVLNAGILFIGGIISSWYLFRMYKRMVYRGGSTEKIEDAILDERYEDAHERIKEGRAGAMSDLSIGEPARSPTSSPSMRSDSSSARLLDFSDSIFSYRGYLYARGNKTRYLGSWAAYWKKRYFVLDRAAYTAFTQRRNSSAC